MCHLSGDDHVSESTMGYDNPVRKKKATLEAARNVPPVEQGGVRNWGGAGVYKTLRQKIVAGSLWSDRGPVTTSPEMYLDTNTTTLVHFGPPASFQRGANFRWGRTAVGGFSPPLHIAPLVFVFVAGG